jgi:hypothetical protein
MSAGVGTIGGETPWRLPELFKDLGIDPPKAPSSLGSRNRGLFGDYPFKFNPPVPVSPQGKAEKVYWERWWENVVTTNKALPGALAPWGMSVLTGGRVAEALETPTLWRWMLGGFKGAPAAGVGWTGVETGVLAVGTSVVNSVVIGFAFEVGVGIGSAVNAAVPDDCNERFGDAMLYGPSASAEPRFMY